MSASAAVAPELVERMCAVIEHRGPDAQGAWAEDGVALGIRRLAVIDLETGDQPVRSEDGAVVVVLNGEIYNYRELREELRARGHRFATEGDTEVIVHLYEEHGERLVDHLRGMFAFALWDRRTRRLLLARDRVGKKPLFYARRGDRLTFASTAVAVLQDDDVPRDADVAAIDAFLLGGYVPHPHSAFAALRKLPPAHTLSWQDGSLRLRRYWRLSYATKVHFGDPGEQDEAVREALLEATRLRLRADVGLGVLLSGGVDSSAVAAAMVRSTSRTVRSFSIGFQEPRFDETSHAEAVARYLGTEHVALRITPDALGVLPRLVWHHGEPFADSSAIPTFQLAELTRRHVTVALNGDGGDEAFAGYQRYRGNVVAARLDAMPGAASALAGRLAERIVPGARPDTRRARAQRLLAAMGRSPVDRAIRWAPLFDRSERRRLYTPEMAARVAALPPPEEALRACWAASDAHELVDRLLDLDVQSYLPGDLLVKMDVASMAHGLEVRSPMLDQEFLALAARLPVTEKLRGGVGKPGLRRAVAPWLPADILERPKAGFEVPLREWLRGPLRTVADDVLLDPAATSRGWFDQGRLRELLREHADGRRDHSGRIWALLTLELWQQTFIDAPARAPVALAAT